jgi:hypothetical protein
MAIKNAEKGALRPISKILFALGLTNIQDY